MSASFLRQDTSVRFHTYLNDTALSGRLITNNDELGKRRQRSLDVELFKLLNSLDELATVGTNLSHSIVILGLQGCSIREGLIVCSTVAVAAESRRLAVSSRCLSVQVAAVDIVAIVLGIGVPIRMPVASVSVHGTGMTIDSTMVRRRVAVAETSHLDVVVGDGGVTGTVQLLRRGGDVRADSLGAAARVVAVVVDNRFFRLRLDGTGARHSARWHWCQLVMV